MIDEHGTLLGPLLHRQLLWVISLRWFAGAAIVLFDLVQWAAGPFFAPAGLMAAIGGSLLAFNAGLAIATRRVDRRLPPRPWLTTAAWAQLVADLVALTSIVLLTGGLSSPSIGFFIFPMIFASLFLSRVQAYGAALLAVALLTASLELSGRWPATGIQRMTAMAWIATLLFSVHLVNRVTRGLFRRERERLRQERRLHEMNERLDAQEQAMRHLEKLVTIGQLAAGVAHEISNPLASMDGLLQLMQRSPDKPRPEAVDRLREQVVRISATLRQMTSLGRPDLGEPEAVDPNTLVRETVEILRYDRRLREVDVRLDLQEDARPITARPRALQQVLMNLLFNAADALADQPTPTIEVRTRLNGTTCRIDVADNGHGVAEADRERIFDFFVTTKPEGLGTGLGLPISRDLVHAHGGELTFEPNPGGGTVFTISLPVGSDAEARPR
ncbi:MAG: HAMP domain-containing histidine kinase [Phycisphaeraceae bacterium]|nr:MAG: HAMP domain-containing histidine kinase [Phycisphaeraceae bacterium]